LAAPHSPLVPPLSALHSCLLTRTSGPRLAAPQSALYLLTRTSGPRSLAAHSAPHSDLRPSFARSRAHSHQPTPPTSPENPT
jgi:hypothetical protein